MRILIKNGHLIDPTQAWDQPGHLLIEDDTIVGQVPDTTEADEVIDAQGQLVTPGLVDLHAELREPGFEEDETVASGLSAAIAGGFTTVTCLPNCDPPVDSRASVEFVLQQAERHPLCRVEVLACVSKGRQGEELAELGSLFKAGAIGFTDAPSPIYNTDLMRRALEYSLMFDRPIFNHPEVRELTVEGIMHEGYISTVLGLGGLPPEAEDVMTSRDLRLAEAYAARVHLMNISSGGSVELIRRAKDRGVNVTAEVTAAHLSLTDESLRSFDPNFKVNPPLRSTQHQQELIRGLQDGTLDAIVSGHAPRSAEKKMRELNLAPFGMMGLETTLSLVVASLIEPGHLSWPAAIDKLSTQPAKILGKPQLGTLAAGSVADIAIIDPHSVWIASPDQFRSKSRNTPCLNQEMRGRATLVLVGGKPRQAATPAER
ncbi:MAG: dihydroorotase [Planctomycetota bacterium]